MTYSKCPVNTDRIRRHSLIEHSAQALLDNWEETDQIFDNLGAGLKERHATMGKARTGKAGYYVARGLHQAGRAALGAVIDTEVTRKFLHHIDDGSMRFMPDREIRPGNESEAYVDIMLGLHVAATRAVFDDLSTNHDHRYRRLWERYQKIASNYDGLVATYEAENEPTQGWEKGGTQGTVVTLSAVRKLLGLWAITHSQNNPSPPAPEALTIGALRQVSQLAWASTISRSKLFSEFGRNWWEGVPTTELAGKLFTRTVDGAERWRISTIQSGPRPDPFYCPGNIALSLPEPAYQQVTQDLLSIVECRSGQKIQYEDRPVGTFDQAVTELVRGALLGEATIFANWPQSAGVG